jgi:hypothetical protein
MDAIRSQASSEGSPSAPCSSNGDTTPRCHKNSDHSGSSSSSSSSSTGSSSSYYSDSSDLSPPPRVLPPPSEAEHLPALVFPPDFAERPADAQRALLRPYAEKALLHTWDPDTHRWGSVQAEVAVETVGFATGAMRQAHRLVDLRDLRQLRVAKRYKRSNIPREQYFSDVLMHTVAQTWAIKFNAMAPPKPVYFLSASVVELFTRSPPMFVACEGYLEGGEFIKHNGNDGFVADQSRATPQAFSHFTYHHTKGALLVCDMQGVGDFYTDPQLHTADGEGYGRGNLGKEGMQMFFRHHHCNSICQFLNLPPSVTALFPMPKGDRIDGDGTAAGKAPRCPTDAELPSPLLSTPMRKSKGAAAAVGPRAPTAAPKMTFLEWIISLLPFGKKKRPAPAAPAPAHRALAPTPPSTPAQPPAQVPRQSSPQPVPPERGGSPVCEPDAVDPYTGAPAVLSGRHDPTAHHDASSMRYFRDITYVRPGKQRTESISERLYGLSEEAWDF